MMGDPKTIRTSRAEQIRKLLGAIFDGSLQIICDRAQGSARNTVVIQKLQLLLQYQKDMGYIIERVHYAALNRHQALLPVERRQRKEALVLEAKYLFVLESFGALFAAALREDLPELFQEILVFIIDLEALDAKRYYRADQFFLPSNPLAWLRAISAAYREETPIVTSLGYTEEPGRESTNAAHMTRAATFVRELRSALKEDDPGYEKVSALRITDSVRPALGAQKTSIHDATSNRTFNVSFREKEVAHILGQYGNPDSTPEETLRTFFLRVAAALAKQTPRS